MKAFILSLLLAGAAGATTTIVGTTRTLNAYSSGYSYYDPSWDQFAHPPGTPWPQIVILPDNRSDTSSPGVGLSSLNIASAADYVGTGRAGATANITPNSMSVNLTARSGNPTGGSPPGLDINPESWYSSASASFEVEFSLDTPASFTVSGTSFYSFGVVAFPLNVSILGTGNTFFILTYPPNNVGGGSYSASGVLPAGTYRFSSSAIAIPINPQEPFYPSTSLNSVLTLVAIPEPGAGLFAATGIAFITVRRRDGRHRP